MIEAQKVQIPYERKPGTIHSFFALKFHDGDADRAKVEAIEAALNKAGVEITLMARDVEKWGEAEIPASKALMRDFAFPAMLQCDCNIIEFSEKGVGLGMNAGFCYASGKPIYVIAKTGSDISSTLADVADEVIFYDEPDDLVEPFERIVKNFPRVILASSSVFRRQQMIDAKIPFEVIVSNADETPDKSKSFSDQLAEIAMRKAMAVLEMTKERGRRLIVAADQNMVFEGKMYGKPKDAEEARAWFSRMRGTDELYAYTGNAILLADGTEILQSVNKTEIARMSVDNISDEELDEYIANGRCLTCCGAVVVDGNKHVRLTEGLASSACGLNIEYALDMLKDLRKN